MESHHPSAAAATDGDTITRLAAAQAHDAEPQLLWQLIDDPHDTIANTARDRLGLALRTPAQLVAGGSGAGTVAR
ncbi:hypothetical protein [Sinomonas atrocyanea]